MLPVASMCCASAMVRVPPAFSHYEAPVKPAWQYACDIACAARVAALAALPRDSRFPAFGNLSCPDSLAPGWPDTS